MDGLEFFEDGGFKARIRAGALGSLGREHLTLTISYLPAAQLEEAVADGHDVRGIMYWTLIDNFEWSFGYHAKFGLYEWNPTMGQTERHMRPSGKLIKRLFKVHCRVSRVEPYARAPVSILPISPVLRDMAALAAGICWANFSLQLSFMRLPPSILSDTIAL